MIEQNIGDKILETHLELALSYEVQGRLNEATKVFERAVETFRKDPERLIEYMQIVNYFKLYKQRVAARYGPKDPDDDAPVQCCRCEPDELVHRIDWI